MIADVCFFTVELTMKAPQSLIVAVFLGAGAWALAQEDPAKHGKIAWHGTWKGGLAEAQRTGKPILLVSAVPQCHSVPGVW